MCCKNVSCSATTAHLVQQVLCFGLQTLQSAPDGAVKALLQKTLREARCKWELDKAAQKTEEAVQEAVETARGAEKAEPEAEEAAQQAEEASRAEEAAKKAVKKAKKAAKKAKKAAKQMAMQSSSLAAQRQPPNPGATCSHTQGAEQEGEQRLHGAIINPAAQHDAAGCSGTMHSCMTIQVLP